MHIRLFPIAVSLSICLLAGCPGTPAKPGAATKGASAKGDGTTESSTESGFKRRTASELPVVADYLPPLDDGRIEIAGPQDWNTLQRNSKSLAGFVKGKPSELPRIVVLVSDPPAAKLADTTEDNADVLATLLEGQLRKDPKKVVPEHCLPIVLGKQVFIRHVRLASLGGDPAVIQSLQTVQGGRLYTVELICAINAADGREYKKSLTDERDNGYAVAANLKFGKGADSLAGVAAEPAADPPPAESPPPPETTPLSPTPETTPATTTPPADPAPQPAEPAAPSPPQP